MEGNKKIKLTTIIGIVVVMAIIIGVGIFIFKNRKASKVQNNNVNNTQNIGNNKIEEEKVKLNKIYTNFTNSKKLNSIDIGLYNDENKQYFKILSVNMPDCYLISRLYYTEGPDDLFLENYKEYDNYNSMKSMVKDIPNIIGNKMISRISISDYIDSSVDEATVLECEVYSKRSNTFEYSDKIIHNGKNIYYGYGKNSILGPTISGIIIIEGNETASQLKNKYYHIKTEDTLRINFRLSNPEMNESNYKEYMKELLNNIEFYK